MNSSSVVFSIHKTEWGNSHTFPSVLYIDTNPVIDMLAHRKYGKLTDEYLKKLVDNGGMITWSRHMIQELTDTVHVTKYIEYAQKNSIMPMFNDQGRQIKAAWKVAEDTVSQSISASLAKDIYNDVEKIIKELNKYGTELDSTNTEEVDALTYYLHSNYGGNRKDAMHAAYSNLNGLNDFLSNDPGIARYPNINVYGASKTILENLNSNQTPTPFIDLSYIVRGLGDGQVANEIKSKSVL